MPPPMKEIRIIYKLLLSKKVTKMQINNLTKNTAISRHVKACDGLLSKFIGLMLSLKQKNSLIFKFNKEQIISLHMIFVFYPIDVLFLNKNRIVVDKKESFRPFAFCKSRKKAMYAIELPNRVIKKTKTEIGDKIEFKQ